MLNFQCNRQLIMHIAAFQLDKDLVDENLVDGDVSL